MKKDNDENSAATRGEDDAAKARDEKDTDAIYDAILGWESIDSCSLKSIMKGVRLLAEADIPDDELENAAACARMASEALLRRSNG